MYEFFKKNLMYFKNSYLNIVASGWERHADKSDGIFERKECPNFHGGALGLAAECNGKHQLHSNKVSGAEEGGDQEATGSFVVLC